MTSRDFCYWLQGFFEVADPNTINADQTDMIKRHLKLVFKHEIDPSIPDLTRELQKIHDGPKKPYCAILNTPSTATPVKPTNSGTPTFPQANSFTMDDAPNYHKKSDPPYGEELIRC